MPATAPSPNPCTPIRQGDDRSTASAFQSKNPILSGMTMNTEDLQGAGEAPSIAFGRLHIGINPATQGHGDPPAPDNAFQIPASNSEWNCRIAPTTTTKIKMVNYRIREKKNGAKDDDAKDPKSWTETQDSLRSHDGDTSFELGGVKTPTRSTTPFAKQNHHDPIPRPILLHSNHTGEGIDSLLQLIEEDALNLDTLKTALPALFRIPGQEPKQTIANADVATEEILGGLGIWMAYTSKVDQILVQACGGTLVTSPDDHNCNIILVKTAGPDRCDPVFVNDIVERYARRVGAGYGREVPPAAGKKTAVVHREWLMEMVDVGAYMGPAFQYFSHELLFTPNQNASDAASSSSTTVWQSSYSTVMFSHGQPAAGFQ
ncbi:hypothetical protein IAT38_005867 [Cryptococcus sp. DSM 104549]